MTVRASGRGTGFMWRTLIGIVTVEQTRRLIIEARLADGDSDTGNDGDGVLVVVERRDYCLAQLGLTLAEGRSLLAKVQAELVSKQVEGWWLSGQTHVGAAARP